MLATGRTSRPKRTHTLPPCGAARASSGWLRSRGSAHRSPIGPTQGAKAANMALARYIGRKVAWTLVVFVVALMLNFLLPRLTPGNPVDDIVGQLAQGGGAGGEQLQQIHEQYMKEFGLDKPLWQQFFIYVGH